MKTSKKRQHKISINKKWLDKEWLKLNELRKLANKKHRHPLIILHYERTPYGPKAEKRPPKSQEK